MTRSEFFSHLQSYYKNADGIILNRFDEWLDDNNIKDDKLSPLFNYITENYRYKSFPSLPDVKEYYKNLNGISYFRTSAQEDKVRAFTKARNSQFEKASTHSDIIEVVHWLQIAKSNQSTMATELLCRWGEILREYWECKRLNMNDEDMIEHLNYVRDALKINEPFVALKSPVYERPKVNLKSLGDLND